MRFSAARGDDEQRPSLEEVVRARIETLDDDARRVLEVTAIAGQPTPQRLVVQATLACRLSGPLAPTWPLALDGAAVFAKLRAASLVRSYGRHGADNVEPYHDRVRESVARDLDADARRTIHRTLAYVLGDVDGIDPERLGDAPRRRGRPGIGAQVCPRRRRRRGRGARVRSRRAPLRLVARALCRSLPRPTRARAAPLASAR